MRCTLRYALLLLLELDQTKVSPDNHGAHEMDQKEDHQLSLGIEKRDETKPRTGTEVPRCGELHILASCGGLQSMGSLLQPPLLHRLDTAHGHHVLP